MSFNNKKEYYTGDEAEEKSLIKESSELQVQSLYQLLIKNPYLVNTVDDKNETILSYSIKNNNISISNLILTSPIIDLEYQDKNGNSYLHLAVMSQQKDIIKLLIEKGIDINKQNKEGNTVLHLAYTVNNKQIINILIDNGIDKNIVNKENKTAEELMPKTKRFNSSSNNRITIAKKKELNKKTDNVGVVGKNINNNNNKKKGNSITANNNVNNKINTNRTKSGKSITSSKSGTKMKVRIIPNKEIKKNNNIQNIYSLNDSVEDTCNTNFINIDEYHKKDNNINNDEIDKKYAQFDRTIKMDWNGEKNNINNFKENDDEQYINYIYKEKDSFGRDQDICNVEVSNSFRSPKKDNILEKKNIQSKASKKPNSNSNKKISIKSNKNEDIKVNKKNNGLNNSMGYNPCISGEYTIKSDQKRSKKTSIFGSKIDISQSQNNEENNIQFNVSKKNLKPKNNNFMNFEENNEKNNINSFHAFSGNFSQKHLDMNMNLNMIKNIPKRKSDTSKAVNRNIVISNKNKNMEDNSNSNIKSSNMESSLITQSRLKTSLKRNNPLIEFLSQINLLKYLNNLDSNGFDDVNLLIEEAKKGVIISDQELKEVGINLPGDRAKILIRLKEKANIFGFAIPKSVYHTCQNLDDIKNDQHIIELNNWLSQLKIDKYLMNFVNNGYHSIELLLMQMETENPLTTEILRDELGIDKIGYRSRILNKLKEEGRNLNNRLKTSILIVNNRGDDKNCECIIF